MQKKTFEDMEVFSVERDYTRVSMLKELKTVAAFVVVLAGLVLVGVIFK